MNRCGRTQIPIPRQSVTRITPSSSWNQRGLLLAEAQSKRILKEPNAGTLEFYRTRHTAETALAFPMNLVGHHILNHLAVRLDLVHGRGRSLAIRAKYGQTALTQWLKSSASIVAFWLSADPWARRTDAYGRNVRLLSHAEHHHAVGGHRHRVFPGIQLQVGVGPEISCMRGCRFQAQVRPLDGDLCGRAVAIK